MMKRILLASVLALTLAGCVPEKDRWYHSHYSGGSDNGDALLGFGASLLQQPAYQAPIQCTTMSMGGWWANTTCR